MLFPLMKKKKLQKKKIKVKNLIISSLLADSFPNILFERNETGCPKMWTSLFTVVYIEMVAGVEWLHHRVKI